MKNTETAGRTANKPAYKVRATIGGKSWMSASTTLTAESMEAAKIKAARVLNLTPEHVLIIEPCTVFNTGAKLETNNYPYGRERATAFFSVEYNGTKGARTVFQTINPKNGKLNNPKKSTYSTVILSAQLENGFFDFVGYFDFNGTKEINRGLQFMADFHDLFTPEQIKDIALTAIAMSKVNAKAMIIYAGSTWEALKPLMDNQIQNLVKIAGTGENLWEGSLFDEAAIEATKPEGYSPFKVTTYTNV